MVPSGDTLIGSAEANTLRGLGGNDLLNGRAGNDWLIGGDGADTIDGGWGDGNDTLTGGSGADSFVFEQGYDDDRITDFEDNVDTIRLLNFGISNFTQASSYATEAGGNVIFDFGSGDTLTVNGTTLAALSNDLAYA